MQVSHAPCSTTTAFSFMPPLCLLLSNGTTIDLLSLSPFPPLPSLTNGHVYPETHTRVLEAAAREFGPSPSLEHRRTLAAYLSLSTDRVSKWFKARERRLSEEAERRDTEFRKIAGDFIGSAVSIDPPRTHSLSSPSIVNETLSAIERNHPLLLPESRSAYIAYGLASISFDIAYSQPPAAAISSHRHRTGRHSLLPLTNSQVNYFSSALPHAPPPLSLVSHRQALLVPSASTSEKLEQMQRDVEAAFASIDFDSQSPSAWSGSSNTLVTESSLSLRTPSPAPTPASQLGVTSSFSPPPVEAKPQCLASTSSTPAASSCIDDNHPRPVALSRAAEMMRARRGQQLKRRTIEFDDDDDSGSETEPEEFSSPCVSYSV